MHIRAARAVWDGSPCRAAPGLAAARGELSWAAAGPGDRSRVLGSWRRSAAAGRQPCVKVLPGFPSLSLPPCCSRFLGVASLSSPAPGRIQSSPGHPQGPHGSAPAPRLYTEFVSCGSALRLAGAGAGPPRPPPRAWGRGGGGSRHCQEARVLVNSGHEPGGSARRQGEGLQGLRQLERRDVAGPRHKGIGSAGVQPRWI